MLFFKNPLHNNNNNNPVDNSLPTLIFLHASSTVVMIKLKPNLNLNEL